MLREATSSPRARLKRKERLRIYWRCAKNNLRLLFTSARGDGPQRSGIHCVEQQRREDDEPEPGDTSKNGVNECDSKSEQGSRLKTPVLPIWVTCINNEWGVLFNPNRDLMKSYSAENRFYREDALQQKQDKYLVLFFAGSICSTTATGTAGRTRRTQKTRCWSSTLGGSRRQQL